MSYEYTSSQIRENQRMSLSSWSLQIIHALKHVSSLFASTFLVSFIMHTNADVPIESSVVSIALYYISTYLVLLLFSSLFFAMVDKGSRVWFYRASIVVKGVFVAALIFIGSDLAKYSYLAGALYGLSEVMYYSGYNVLKSEIIPSHHADKFVANESVFDRLVEIVCPVLLGLLIDVSIYIYVAFYVAALVAVQLIMSCFVKSTKPANSSFNLREYARFIKQDKEVGKRLKTIYAFALAYGVTAIKTPIATVLCVYTFHTNLNLGIFTALISLVTATLLLCVKKFTKLGKRSAITYTLAIMCVASSVLVAFMINKWTYLVYALVLEVGICILYYGFDVQRTTVLKEVKRFEFIAEHQAVCELCFNLVRVVSFGLLILLTHLWGLNGVKALLIILTIGYVLMGVFVSRIERQALAAKAAQETALEQAN